MPPVRKLAPGHVVTYPNREKPVSHLTRVLVVATLIASVVLIMAVTIGGWNALQGLGFMSFVWSLVYVLMAVGIARWARGLLPIAAGLAILCLIISCIAGLDLSNHSWFERSHPGYAAAHSLFGGTGLSSNVLGTLVILLIPVQALLIILAMYGFTQGWNVEVEKHIDEVKGGRQGRYGPPAPAGPHAA